MLEPQTPLPMMTMRAWVNVFIAFGTSGISKWLARGFGKSQKRVAFEAEMIFRGMTTEHAADAVARLLDR